MRHVWLSFLFSSTSGLTLEFSPPVFETSVQKSVFPCCCSERAWSANSTDGSQKYLCFVSPFLLGNFFPQLLQLNFLPLEFFRWGLLEAWTLKVPPSRQLVQCNFTIWDWIIIKMHERGKQFYQYLNIRKTSTTAWTELKGSGWYAQRDYQGLIVYLIQMGKTDESDIWYCPLLTGLKKKQQGWNWK